MAQQGKKIFDCGQLVGERYQVEEFIGGGADTEVYKVVDIVSGKILALKTVKNGVAGAALLSLSQEFFYLSQINHPGVVAVHDYGRLEDGRPYFTMEFVPGVPINRYFAGGYSPELLDVILQVLLALDAIHARGFVHCDLKPAHLLVCDGDGKVKVKLLDFGFAEEMCLSGSTEARGTPGYVAPEVMKGVGADARADLYSLGMVIYETITGTTPGKGIGMLEWLKRQEEGNFHPPRFFDPEIPEAVDRVVMELLNPDRSRRPPSARAVIEALAGENAFAGELPYLRRDILVPGFVGRAEILKELKALVPAAASGQARVVCISGDRGVGKSRLLAEFKFYAELEGATVFSFEPGALGARSQSLLEVLVNLLKGYGEKLELEMPEGAGSEVKYQLFEAVTQRLKALAQSHRVRHSLVLIVDDFELFEPTSIEFLRYLTLSVETDRLLLVIAGLKERRFLEIIEELATRSHFRHFSIPPFNSQELRELVLSLLVRVNDLDLLVTWLGEFTGGNPLWVVETIHALVEAKVLQRQSAGWQLDCERLRAFRPPASITDTVKHRLELLTAEEIRVLEIGAAAGGPFTLEFLRAGLNIEEKVLFNAVQRLKALGFLRPFRALALPDKECAAVGWVLSSKVLEAAVTERLTIEQRRENHRKVALTLELIYPERIDELVFDLAHHWTQAGVKDRAFEYSLRAGRKARALLLFEQALVFYENALALSAGLVSLRERVELMEQTGELRELTGRFTEAIDLYRQGMGMVVAETGARTAESELLSRDKKLLARFLRRLGLLNQKQGMAEEACNLLSQALRLEGEAITLDRVRLLADLGWSLCALGNFAKAEEVLTSALQLAEKLRSADIAGANQLVALILYYFSVLAWSRFDFVLALQLAERSLEVYERFEDNIMSATVSQFIATLYLRRAENQKAKEFYQRALVRQRRCGSVYYLLFSLHGLGIINFDEGDWDRAQELFSEGLRIAERIGNLRHHLDLLICLGAVSETKGNWQEAQGFYDRALTIEKRAGDTLPVSLRTALFVNAALLKAKQGDLSAAEDYLNQAQAVAGECKDPDIVYELRRAQATVALRGERFPRALESLVAGFQAVRMDKDWRRLVNLYTLAGELRLATGDYFRAEFDANRALTLLKEYPSSLEYAIALRIAGRARCGLNRLEKGLTEIRRSIELLRGLGVKYELALSLLASGTAVFAGAGAAGLKMPMPGRQMSREEFNEIKENLKEAKGIFERLGAKIELQKAEELLNAMESVFGMIELKGQERSEYLRVFYQLSELINLGLERDDFLERVLDLVLTVTRAERGLIFLYQKNRLVPVAARDIDHQTLTDAESVSHSVLRKVKRRGEPFISADALVDPRLNSFDSVVLNKIRSLLCVPLVVDQRVIGTIYLDSRITSHLFVEEDRNLLIAVANLLAATIDRSTVFRQFQEELAGLREDILVDAATGLFLGRSKRMRQVYDIIDRIAPTDCTVLLTGETGTGKGVIARLIHQRSGRKDNKFVAVNCGTLPETLFESELFGHVKGSFTGAIKDKMGLFETAHGGTIFLDEITNTTLTIQAKLLQVLEEKVIRRVGDTEPRMVDVRLICATNKNLAEEVKAGRFREDLYYRMNVVQIEVPPLRERASDIPHLSNYFLQSYCAQLNKPLIGFEDDVIRAFTQYSWPGNVRELQNTIERAVIMTQNRKITLEDVGAPFTEILTQQGSLGGKRRVIDKTQVVQALKESGGNITKAAQILATHRRQLQRLIKRYQIDRRNIT